MEQYLYERAEKRFYEMKAGQYISHEDSMDFIREYAQQNQSVAVWRLFDIRMKPWTLITRVLNRIDK